MDTRDGKIIVSSIELNDRDTLRQIEAIAAKALRDNGIMQGFGDMRSATTIAEDFGLLIVDDLEPEDAKGSVATKSLVL